MPERQTFVARLNHEKGRLPFWKAAFCFVVFRSEAALRRVFLTRRVSEARAMALSLDFQPESFAAGKISHVTLPPGGSEAHRRGGPDF